jgi:hypothetical protein
MSMNRKTASTIGAIVVVACGLTAARIMSQPAKAADAAKATAAPKPVAADTAPAAAALPAPASPSGRARIAELFAGKIHPMTLQTEALDESFHMLKLYDIQGHFAVYVSKGDTLVFGGQTFIVVYDFPMTSGLSRPPHPKPEATGKMILVNMSAVQAITEITDIPEMAEAEPEPEKKAK